MNILDDENHFRCHTCQALAPKSWLRSGANGACQINGKAYCSNGCYLTHHTEPTRTVAHIPVNKAKIVRFKVNVFRRMDGNTSPTHDAYGMRE